MPFGWTLFWLPLVAAVLLAPTAVDGREASSSMDGNTGSIFILLNPLFSTRYWATVLLPEQIPRDV
jgi:hypothetical protein